MLIKKTHGIFTSIILLAFVSVCFASMPIDSLFNPEFEDSGTQMDLQGIGQKDFFFVKIFKAGFYLGEGIDTEDVLNDVPKRILVSYYHPIPSKKLCRYTKEKMEENLTEKEYRSLREEIELMDSYFVDLGPGDNYSLTYLPDVGTKFAYNGKHVGIIEGKLFAKALFSVWVGKNPMDKNIKKQILGYDQLVLINPNE